MVKSTWTSKRTGHSKVAALQVVVVWVNGRVMGREEDLRLSHIIPEESASKQGRKGCVVWVRCNHREKEKFVCVHSPPCIKYCQGFCRLTGQ